MFDVNCKFHLPSDSPWHDAANALEALRPYAEWLGQHDPTMRRWFLGGDSLEEAYRYEAFADEANGHMAAKAVISTKYKHSREPVVFLWNGDESPKTGASLVLSVTETGYPSEVSLELDGAISMPRLGDFRETAEFVALLARDTEALCCYVYNESGYFPKMAFKDRPGVGWMIYLPRVLTVQDVPEAGALIAVVKDKRQLGTIVVSVTNAIFDHRDPEHLKVALAIETRLVSQDMLPTWAQMTRPAA